MSKASVPVGDDGGAREAEDVVSAHRATPLWLAATITVVFGLLYAYDVWEAVGNLVGLNMQASTLGVSLSGWGIALLVAAILVPLVVFGLAYWLGRHRGPAAQALLFLVGYAVVQALTLDVAALFELGGLDFS